MGKRGRNSKTDTRNPKRRPRDEDISPDNMDDEIDSFHKQRDVVPLDVNDDVGESDEDNELPVFDYKDINDEDEDEDEDDDDDDVDNDVEIAKMKRQLKFLQAKTGGIEEQMDDDDEEEEEEGKIPWAGKKYLYGDIADNELSNEDNLAKEEAEVLRMQREKVKNLSMEDFGLEDDIEDVSDGEPTIEEILGKGKASSKSPADKEVEDDNGTVYEEVKKDLNSLSKEEQMDVVYTTAPELVGLLSELNAAFEHLETKVNPILSKVKGGNNIRKGGINYLEVKQRLLLAYCQAIVFYLLLKSEGKPVRDHPVIARLVEIKNLLDKVNQLDEYLPPKIEEILKEEHGAETRAEFVKEKVGIASDSFTNNHEISAQAEMASEKDEVVEAIPLKEYKTKGGKCKSQNDQVGTGSMHMFKVRAALEEKLNQKGIYANVTKPNSIQKNVLQPMNGQLETLDDFDDDTMHVASGSRELSDKSKLGKLSLLVTSKANKPKFVSGDDDLPKRDDVGERRRKYEQRVLARAGTKCEDDAGDELGKILDNEDADVEKGSETEGSEDEFYKQVKNERASKLSFKDEVYSRSSAVPSSPETVDGKRHITYQMDKNRGLTRSRKKLTKNPRKKYKINHTKAVMRRKGQVRDVKKPTGPYGGEASGINAGISRSIRFKS